ncbi:dihydrolipoyl dehydrogenase family protein [Rubrobacter indicoceani]|uniref:dihydrolipoyl dehydrogenase family protein n=1 Tax=Rubrobacter indicoceani TaxID=2051957 RepID=UPI000E5BF1AC|nr:FAD-dependent oxidoreductase [Rubrobacter indicoceani]
MTRSNDPYDLVVIGGGTAGLVSAAGGASLGARVALVEYDRLGGDCLFYGCVPTKTLVKSAHVAKTVRTSTDFGVKSSPPEIDFPAVMARMRGVIEQAGEADDPGRFRDLGVDVRLGERASFVSSDTVMVGGARLRSRSFIIATGSEASVPPVDGLDKAGYLTNVEVLQLEELPGSLTVLGSGPIGCEFAQIFARFGVAVTIVSDAAPLPKEDPEVGRLIKAVLEADGVTVHEGFLADSVSVESGEKVLVAKNRLGREITIRSEEILVATGRSPVTGTLALENAGVRVGKSGITVDEYLRTTADNIYAAGDVTGMLPFTHAAEFQAKTALRNALFPVRSRIDYSAVPWTTFTAPEVARVGLTENEAREKYGDVKVWRKDFSGVDRAMADGETVGFEKIVCRKNGEILGAHIVGPDAGNIVHELVLAMRKGIKVGDISQTVHVYPTLAQVNQRAADGFYREKLFGGPAGSAFRAYFGARRRLGRVREVWRPG